MIPRSSKLERVSVIMPTLNSERTIRRALTSVTEQTYPRSAIEILVVDGGSMDATRTIAEEFGCRIIPNERVQPEFAKYLGLTGASGKYAMFLDSDEVLLRSTAIADKVRALSLHPEVRNVITAGLRNPPDYPPLNDYINRFGEPFSYFIYGLDGGDYVDSLPRHYQVSYEDDGLLVVEFAPTDILPICDGGGHFFDLEFLKLHAQIEPSIVPVIFPLMAGETGRLAVVKGDFTIHYSSTSVRNYLRKIKWRIISNVHGAGGLEGYKSRERIGPQALGIRKYLFLLYGVTLVGPLLDSVRLAMSRRQWLFLLHFYFTLYIVVLIVLQQLLKVTGFRPALGSYGS